jgi:hypothetical protein
VFGLAATLLAGCGGGAPEAVPGPQASTTATSPSAPAADWLQYHGDGAHSGY